MPDNPKLTMIMDKTDAGKFAMWACMTEGIGCRRNGFRSAKRRCPDCLGPLPDNLTLGEVHDFVLAELQCKLAGRPA